VKQRLLAPGLALGAAAIIGTVSAPAEAKPQWNAGLESGVCGTSGSLGLAKPGFCNALHGDVLFLRKGSRDFGVGPVLRLGTASFDDLRLDPGVSALLPLFDSFPLVLEAGPQLRNFNQPGAFVGAFFGLRSFNHYGHYEMAAGLSIFAEHSFTREAPSSLWITARIDGSWIALPLVFVYNALK
jgi:hypothetical protein